MCLIDNDWVLTCQTVMAIKHESRLSKFKSYWFLNYNAYLFNTFHYLKPFFREPLGSLEHLELLLLYHLLGHAKSHLLI